MTSLRLTGRAIVRPLLRFALTLFAASIIIFALMRAVPGNPARVALGPDLPPFYCDDDATAGAGDARRGR